MVGQFLSAETEKVEHTTVPVEVDSQSTTTTSSPSVIVKETRPLILKKPALLMSVIALCAFMFAFGYWTGLNSWRGNTIMPYS